MDKKILDIQCNKGIDLGKWERAKIGFWMGLDISQDSLSEARERWEQKQKPFAADFKRIDVFSDNIKEVIDRDIHFDAVCCFSGIQLGFASNNSGNLFFQNAACRLKKGGLFFGILPDSSAIWYKAQKTAVPVIKGELITLTLADDCQTFGTKYNLKLEDGTDSDEYLVHFPTFIHLAKDNGFKMLEIVNLLDFYDEYKVIYGAQLKSLGVVDKKHPKMLNSQQEILSLYTTFVFQKE